MVARLPTSLKSETAISSPQRKVSFTDTVKVAGHSRKMADTRSHNEESPNDMHPLTSITEDEAPWALRGKAIEKKTRVKNCLTKSPKKMFGQHPPSFKLCGPQEKTLLAMKSEATGRCDLDEIGVADNMVIKWWHGDNKDVAVDGTTRDLSLRKAQIETPIFPSLCTFYQLLNDDDS